MTSVKIKLNYQRLSRNILNRSKYHPHDDIDLRITKKKICKSNIELDEIDSGFNDNSDRDNGNPDDKIEDYLEASA